MKLNNKPIIVVAVLLLLLVVYLAFAFANKKNLSYLYYPIDQTVPLKIEFAISQGPDGHSLNIDRMAVNKDFIYLLDFDSKDVLRFNHDGSYDGIAYDGDQDSIPMVAAGFAVNDENDFVISNMQTVVVRIDDEIKIFRNLYHINEVVIHGNRIFTLAPNEKGIIAEYDHNMRYQRSFGKPAYNMYDYNDRIQSWVWFGIFKGDLMVVPFFMPMYSQSSVSDFTSEHHVLPIDNRNSVIDYKKREIEDYYKFKGGMENLIYGAAFCDDAYYLAFKSEEHYLIQEIKNGKVEKVYSIEHWLKNSDADAKYYGILSVAAISTVEGVKFVIHNSVDSEPIIVVSPKNY